MVSLSESSELSDGLYTLHGVSAAKWWVGVHLMQKKSVDQIMDVMLSWCVYIYQILLKTGSLYNAIQGIWLA